VLAANESVEVEVVADPPIIKPKETIEVIVVKDSASDQDYNKIKFSPGQMREVSGNPNDKLANEDAIDRTTIV
jgi:hypothetical protein